MIRCVIEPDTSVSTTTRPMAKAIEIFSSVLRNDSTWPSVHFITSVAFQGPDRSTGSSIGSSCAGPWDEIPNPIGWRANGAKRVISGRSPRGAAMRLEGVYASR